VLDLSPTKLIIIFVVAIFLLGPKRLPQVARQLGVAWAKVRTFSQRIDGELRQTMPDLPTGRDIVRYARSPITLLNDLADGVPGDSALVEDPGAPSGEKDTAPSALGGARRWPQDPAGAGRTGPPMNSTESPRSKSPSAAASASAESLGGAAHADFSDLAHLAVDDPTLN